MLMGLTLLYKHPEVKPALLTHFEPWFALDRRSIGAISTADLTTGELKSFTPVMQIRSLILKGKDMQTGSNGFALAQPKQLQEMRFFTSIPILLFISDLKYR
jgi:hypothetical protein